MPAITVHPTPQNRHWALVYLIDVSANTCLAGKPAMVTAAAAAVALIKSRLSSFIFPSFNLVLAMINNHHKNYYSVKLKITLCISCCNEI
jgi:hypothetical protein